MSTTEPGIYAQMNEFLTHTVQMKRDDINYGPYKQTLVLNPHGSDETKFKGGSSMAVFMFLTHTVQMKQRLARKGTGIF